MARIAPLFAGWEETMVWSVLQGKMGAAYADNAQAPRAAQLCIADFCFLAGAPNGELASHLLGEFEIWIPRTEDWQSLIERQWGENAKTITRYAFDAQPAFDQACLRAFVGQAAYPLQLVDEPLYRALRSQEWSRDLVSQFPDFQAYAAHGVGVAALNCGEPVCGASTYTYYDGGIEIEIDTKPEFRRKGLARACASALILECLRRGLVPSWDAANPESAHLAQTLGFGEPRAYLAYEITKKEPLA
ncbi:GNAT family N-acetyltransferase [Agathobaculum sp.]|uniref:GNAT family N-acetyltransferase n=1 Tax=Agathobaculum sp. TaxID=2048138 RepID=UPI002A81893A|nr:GNAT family N-acetyltransferase [Agathobaculum sp.]MDY3619429.1 GNAT family N-acetyltransferase [Agathobaculum sp.]